MNNKNAGDNGPMKDNHLKVYKMSQKEIAEVYFFMREMCWFMIEALKDEEAAVLATEKYQNVLDIMTQCENIVLSRKEE